METILSNSQSNIPHETSILGPKAASFQSPQSVSVQGPKLVSIQSSKAASVQDPPKTASVQAPKSVSVHSPNETKSVAKIPKSKDSSPAQVLETEKRETWKNHLAYILTSIGFSVGFGNVWRYPYLAFENGGAAFVIPYVCSVIMFGLPFYTMEAFLGQLTGTGAGQAHGYLAPLFQGVGWGMVCMSYMISLYYNVIIAWCLFYLGSSFMDPLPWSNCAGTWHTQACTSYFDLQNCIDSLNDTGAIYYNRICYNSTAAEEHNINATYGNGTKYISSTQEYFELFVLMKSDKFDGISSISWRLAVALLSAWILVFLSIAKGVTVSGKIVYFTAIFPYVMLLILLIRASLLPGAGKGVKYYLIPDLKKLGYFSVWKDAAIQVFFSLGPSLGGLITMTSYNPFHNNLERDSIIVCCMDSLTSLLAGCAIFASLGYLAHTLHVEVPDVVASGLSLVFVAYPETLQRMPLPQLWSVLFFFMLCTLGLGSQFVLFETASTAICDMFPVLRPRKYRVIFVGYLCLFSFLFSLLFCTNVGIFIFILFDDYSIGYCSIIVALGEAVLIAFVYGIDHFIDDISLMLGKKLNWYWRITWLFFTPFYSLVLFSILIYSYSPSNYGKDYVFPHGIQQMGWVISSFSVISIVGFAIFHIVKICRAGKPWIALVMPSELYNPKKRHEEALHVTRMEKVAAAKKAKMNVRSISIKLI